eukprot:s4469_g1.t1
MERLLTENGISAGYWPLEWSDELWNLVTTRPPKVAPDTSTEFKMSPGLDVLVRTHSTPRHKIYDFEDTDPNEKFSVMQLTIAWMVFNQKAVVCSYRRGRKGPYLPDSWTGHTVHLRITPRA